MKMNTQSKEKHKERQCRYMDFLDNGISKPHYTEQAYIWERNKHLTCISDCILLHWYVVYIYICNIIYNKLHYIQIKIYINIIKM